MRTESVEFECDQCNRTEPGRLVDTSSGSEQFVQPLGWFVLEARHVKREGQRNERLKADVCSVECAQKQIVEWDE